jgi:hypothetical protein
LNDQCPGKLTTPDTLGVLQQAVARYGREEEASTNTDWLLLFLLLPVHLISHKPDTWLRDWLAGVGKEQTKR